MGTTLDYSKIEPLAMKHGAFLTEANSENGIILGHMLSLELFNTINSTVGKTVTIMGEKFMVVGVLDEVDQSINFDNVDFDNAAIVDINAIDKLTDSTQIQQINIKAENTDSLAQISDTIRTKLIAKKHGDQNFTVAYGDAITHPAGSLFSIISGMLALVAGISLVVGGIGVMNIMLVSVVERTKEIGIRKALGAQNKDIERQFLSETVFICLIGGLLGVALGLILGFAGAQVGSSIIQARVPDMEELAHVTVQPSMLAILVSVGFSMLTGLVFGLYPARRAARMSPIDALRYE